MLRSLYSGVSGLKNHQIRMDVIGNNIANVNTPGFKSSRVVFQDIYNQTLKPASASGTMGGTNPQQVGLGVSVAAIDVMQTRTGDQYTGAPLDVSIEGDGFFAVSDGTANYFSRLGDFTTDGTNTLINPNGYRVQGYMYNNTTNPPTMSATLDDIVIPANYDDITITKDGDIVGVNKTTNTKESIARIAIATFNNQNSLEKQGESLYAANANSGAPTYTTPNTNGSAALNPGSLEMSNVDLAQEFTDMIVTQRGFQANSRIITTSDTLLQELLDLKRS